MKWSSSRRTLQFFAVIVTSLLIWGCGGSGFELKVDALDARLRVSDRELPDGFTLDDITVEVVPAAQSALQETSESLGSSQAFPADELLAEFDLQPSGLIFDPPAELELTLPAPEEGGLFEFLLVSGDSEDYAPVKEASFSNDGSSVTVVVEIAHFSGLRIRASRWGRSTVHTNRFYQLDVRAPSRARVGEQFDAVAETRRRKDLTVWSKNDLETGSEFKFYTPDDEPWRLQGSWETNKIIEPREVPDRPPRSLVDTTFKVFQEFTCARAGDGELRYLAKAETGVKFRYMLVSDEDGETVIVESEEDLRVLERSRYFWQGTKADREYWARRIKPSQSVGLLVAKVKVVCEGDEAPEPTPTRTPFPPFPTPGPEAFLSGLAARLLSEGYGATWFDYSFESDPEMLYGGYGGFEFDVEKIEPRERTVGEPFHVRVRAFFDHPDLARHFFSFQDATLLVPATVTGRVRAENLELLPSHTTNWLKNDYHSLREPPEELLAVATFSCVSPGPASYTVSLSGFATYRSSDKHIATIESPLRDFDSGAKYDNFGVEVMCVEEESSASTPTPTTVVSADPTSTPAPPAVTPRAESTRAPATSVDADPVDPCDLVGDEYVIAVLGNPVNQNRGKFFGNAWNCTYSAEAQPLEAFWIAFIRVRSHEIDRRFLDGNFFVFRGVRHAEFVVLNDDEGLVTDLLAAGAVTTSGGESLPVSRGDARPDLGSTVLVYKRGTIGGLGAVVTVLAKVPGYHLWLEVVVGMSEPWGLTDIPQDQEDAIVASLPRIEEHVPRALELTGLFMDALLEIQGD